MIRVAVVIVNYRNAPDTLACLDSLAAAEAERAGNAEAIRVLVIDNRSGDGSAARIRERLEKSPLPASLHEMEANLGFTGGCNFGIRQALADGFSHVLLLNSDTLVSPGFTGSLLRAAARHPEAVLAGPVSLLDTGKSAGNLGSISPWTLLIEFHYPDPQGPVPRFDFISGCLMLVPSGVFQKLGCLDEKFFLYCEDLEFCLRLKRHGVSVRFDPSLAVRHRVGATVDATAFPKEYYRMRNQTFIVLNQAGLLQRILYLARIAGVLLINLGRPNLVRQFLAGIGDAFAGRMGYREGMRA